MLGGLQMKVINLKKYSVLTATKNENKTKPMIKNNDVMIILTKSDFPVLKNMQGMKYHQVLLFIRLKYMICY